MKKLLLLLGFLAGTAQAADEYYTLSSVVTTVQPVGDPSGTGPLTITGWIETDGFGRSGCPGIPVCGPGGPGFTTPIIGYEINWTYNGVTETRSGGQFWGQDNNGIVATPKGLFCNLCDLSNEGYPFFALGASRVGNGPVTGGAGYQYELNGGGQLDFGTGPLKNHFRIGNAPTTTMPTTAAMAAPEMDPGQAVAALMLLVGTALVLKGRRRE